MFCKFALQIYKKLRAKSLEQRAKKVASPFLSGKAVNIKRGAAAQSALSSKLSALSLFRFFALLRMTR